MLEPAVLLVTAGGFRSMKGALVTGAGMRVGRALAMALAADGFFTFVHHHRSAGPARGLHHVVGAHLRLVLDVSWLPVCALYGRAL
jgi:NAD(P)-dependent dehydrogenase (short-subunit alcohol dehydrogenase family)